MSMPTLLAFRAERPTRSLVPFAELQAGPWGGIDSDELYLPPDPDYTPRYDELVGVQWPDGSISWDVWHRYEPIGTYGSEAEALAAWWRCERAGRRR